MSPSKPLHVVRWRLLGVWIAVFTAVTFWTIYHVRSDEAHTKAALCTFRADLIQRIEQSTVFLAEHPHGIPGIPAATIRDGIRNQQRTINALSSLHCQPKER